MTATQLLLSVLSALAVLHSIVETAFISSGKHGLITSLGDFNNDKYTDIVTINRNNSISIWYYKEKDTTDGSRISKQGDLVVDDLRSDQFIVAAVPGDFNADNALDVAVLLSTNTTGRNYELRIFYHDQSDATTLKLSPETWDFRFNGQPLIADINGDQVPDFVGKLSGNNTLHVVLTVNAQLNSGENVEAFKTYRFKSVEGTELEGSINDNCGHSFAHVVGDNQPDMIICMDKSFQVWEGDRGQYSFRGAIPFPTGKTVHGNAIVLDIDLDGKQEFVFPVCVDEDCNESEMWYYEIEEAADKNQEFAAENWILLHSFTQESTSTTKSFTKHSMGNPKLITNNLILRAGDVDFDGYPDFLTVLRTQDDNVRGLFLLNNIKCGGNAKLCGGSRGISTRDLSLPNVETGVFFDYKEDGGNNLIYSVFQNDDYTMGSKDISDKGDSSFLKVMVIGGHCGPGGDDEQQCRFGQDVNYGANLPGPTIKYETQGSDGGSRVGVWTQLSQGTHQAVQPPWVIFGLGQVANFVEKLTITLASDDKVGEASMENVIPNSQLILIPYPPDKPSKWAFQLLLTPSDIIWKFAIALLSVVVVLGLIVIILQYQEKREDDAEKREEAHKFHFDAM